MIFSNRIRLVKHRLLVILLKYLLNFRVNTGQGGACDNQLAFIGMV